MPRRRARDSASTPSEGSGSSADSTAPPPPPGIDQFTKFRPGGDPAARAPGGGAGAAGKQEEEEKARQPALFHKTKMCKFNNLGICTRGRLCRFAHGKIDQNPLPDLSRTKLCKDLINTGQCTNPGCKFAHTKQELRRHPFVRPSDNKEHLGQQAAAKGAAQKPHGAMPVPEAALGQEVAQLQASANLLCTDLANILGKMREKQLQAQLHQLSQQQEYGPPRLQAKPSSMLSYHGMGGDVHAGLVPSDLGSLLGGFGEKEASDPWTRAAMDSRFSSGYLGQNDRPIYHPAGRPVDSTRREKPEPKLLSPMYAPAMTLADPPPFALV